MNIEAALRAALLRGPAGDELWIAFDMHTVVECLGIGEPEVQLQYRAFYTKHYEHSTRRYEVIVTRIEENGGTARDPIWMADSMPRAARAELEKLIEKALNEQAAIDATEIEDSAEVRYVDSLEGSEMLA